MICLEAINFLITIQTITNHGLVSYRHNMCLLVPVTLSFSVPMLISSSSAENRTVSPSALLTSNLWHWASTISEPEREWEREQERVKIKSTQCTIRQMLKLLTELLVNESLSIMTRVLRTQKCVLVWHHCNIRGGFKSFLLTHNLVWANLLCMCNEQEHVKNWNNCIVLLICVLKIWIKCF